MELSKAGIVEKSWGYENIIVSNLLYCNKKLVFNEKYGSTSMHFHRHKTETFFAERGSFLIRIIDLDDTSIKEYKLDFRDSNNKNNLTLKPFVFHQIIAMEDNSILVEVSTADYIVDSYRVYRTSKEDLKKELT